MNKHAYIIAVALIFGYLCYAGKPVNHTLSDADQNEMATKALVDYRERYADAEINNDYMQKCNAMRSINTVYERMNNTASAQLTKQQAAIDCAKVGVDL